MHLTINILVIVAGAGIAVFPRRVIHFILDRTPLNWFTEWEPDAGGMMITIILGIIMVAAGLWNIAALLGISF